MGISHRKDDIRAYMQRAARDQAAVADALAPRRGVQQATGIRPHRIISGAVHQQFPALAEYRRHGRLS
jgi:hypothetical protein